jgi:hypothetical protein
MLHPTELPVDGSIRPIETEEDLVDPLAAESVNILRYLLDRTAEEQASAHL